MNEETYIIKDRVVEFFKDRGVSEQLEVIVERFLQSYFEYGKSVTVAVEHASLSGVKLSKNDLIELEEILRL